MRPSIFISVIFCTSAFAFFGIGKKQDKSKVYTLYRSGAVDKNIRLHFASFDADDGSNSEAYNRQNCEKTKILLSQVTEAFPVKYWCEKGYYKE